MAEVAQLGMIDVHLPAVAGQQVAAAVGLLGVGPFLPGIPGGNAGALDVQRAAERSDRDELPRLAAQLEPAGLRGGNPHRRAPGDHQVGTEQPLPRSHLAQRGRIADRATQCFEGDALPGADRDHPGGESRAYRGGPLPWLKLPWLKLPWLKLPWLKLPWLKLPWLKLPWLKLPWLKLPWLKRVAGLTLAGTRLGRVGHRGRRDLAGLERRLSFRARAGQQATGQHREHRPGGEPRGSDDHHAPARATTGGRRRPPPRPNRRWRSECSTSRSTARMTSGTPIAPRRLSGGRLSSLKPSSCTWPRSACSACTLESRSCTGLADA